MTQSYWYQNSFLVNTPEYYKVFHSFQGFSGFSLWCSGLREKPLIVSKWVSVIIRISDLVICELPVTIQTQWPGDPMWSLKMVFLAVLQNS